MSRIIIAGLLLSLTITPVSARNITFDDLYSIPSCGDPRISPDGKLIAFGLHTSDPRADSEQDHLWIMNADGSGARQLTFGTSGEWQPRWSPDGKTIFFLTDREDGVQIWTLPLNGGEARRISTVPTSVNDFEIFPDGGKIHCRPRPETPGWEWPGCRIWQESWHFRRRSSWPP